MGWCKETVRPAIKNIRRQLTVKVLQEIAGGMAFMAPLVADGKVDGADATKAIEYAIAAKHNITKTAVGMGVKLIHETTARGTETLTNWSVGLGAADAEGEAEVDEFLDED